MSVVWEEGGTVAWMYRVLIAEDEHEIRFLYTRWLRRSGHEPVEVEAGDQVMAALAVGEFDLVLLDVMMPGLDGYSVCEQIRAKGLELPVVMMSALTRPQDIARGLGAGASMYVDKVVSEEDLLSVVTRAMRGEVHLE